MTNIGGITIQMAADVARLKADMDAAKGIVSGGARQMQQAADTVKGAFAALGLGLSAAAFGGWIKGAINAADETFNLSQKVGVAAQDLAGLKLAFGQAGIESGAMQTALVKLSKGVAEGNEVFGRLGVAVKTADGSLKTSKQVLYDVADVFASMPDGINKTALATELFGKAGADLVPMLNGGSQGMRDMADMAEKLGLVIDDKTAKAADEFNDTLDLLGKGLEGVGIQVAAELLPTLNSLAGSFLTSMTEGDRLKTMAAGLSTVLKGLYSVAVGLVGGLTAAGQALGGLAAGAVLLVQGEVKQAAAVMAMAWDDAGDTIKSTKVEIVKAWDDTASATVTAGVDMLRAQKAVGDGAKQTSAAHKAAAEDAKKQAAAVKAAAAEMIKAEAAQEKWRQEWLDAEAARSLQRIKQYEDQQAAVDKSVQGAEDMLAAILRETAALGMSNTEREISAALLDLERQGLERGSYAYDVYAEKIRAAIVDRDAVRSSIEQTKAIGDEWKKVAQSIGDSLTDSLFRAFESGKDFGQALRDGLVNTFKTTILRPVIQAVMAPVTGAMGSMFSGGASAAGGASSLGGLGSLGSLAGLGSAFSGGLGMTMSGLGGTGLALEGAGAMMGSGSMMAGLAQGAGALGPYALAGLAIYSLAKKLDKSGTPHMGSVVGADAAGQFSMVGDGSTIMDNYSADTDAALRGISGLSVNALNGLSTQFGGSGGYSATARFAADGQDASIGQYVLSQNGRRAGYVGNGSDFAKYSSNATEAYAEFANDIAGATAQAVKAIDLPRWAKDQFRALGTDATIEAFGMVADSVIRTQSALRDLAVGINPLGGIFTSIAGLSSDALFQLAGFAGGIEALGQKAGAFASTYYNADEQAGIQARALRESLKAAGFSGSTIRNLDTKAEFRDLVETRDLDTRKGREQLAALLDLAPSFAALTEYFAANGGNLNSTANNAPASAMIDSVLDSTLKQTEAASTANATAEANNALLQRIVDALNSGNNRLLDSLVESTQVQRLIADGGSDVVRVMRRVSNTLDDISSNGSLGNAAPPVYNSTSDGA